MTSPRWVTEVLRPAIERGAGAAGRDPGEISVTTNLIVQVDRDREAARREAALQLGFYATTRTYAPVLALHGFEDRIGPLRKAFVRGDTAGMVELALPMVDTLAVAGTPREAGDRIAAYDGVADRLILGGAWVGPSPQRLRESYQLLVETFAPGSPAATA